MALIIVLGIFATLIFYSIGIYNSLISLRNSVRNSFAQIDVELQRRYDLIPNLVETAKAYMTHEKSTLEAVINARNQANSAKASAASSPDEAGAIAKLNAAESLLGKSLGNFFALAENYPELKANTLMQQLMNDLKSTEDKLAFSRQHYNQSATQYNTAIEKFPNNLVASSFKFNQSELLRIENESIKEAPKVQF